MKKEIIVDGSAIRIKIVDQTEYICISDMAKKFNERGEVLIQNWLRSLNTIEYLILWEQLHNEKFNHIEIDVIRKKAGSNTFIMSPSKWIKTTNAIGLETRRGRYGGTYAHSDIAFEFGSWLSPPFKLYLITEFQRLKEEEMRRLDPDWRVRRLLASANWHIHSEAVRTQLVPHVDWNTKREEIYQASEADLLNLVVFGMTAKEWRRSNPEAKGNIRDSADTLQLLVLSNLQVLNSKLLEWDCEREQRLDFLRASAEEWMGILMNTQPVARLEELREGKLKKG